jgi:hypothetical protein
VALEVAGASASFSVSVGSGGGSTSLAHCGFVGQSNEAAAAAGSGGAAGAAWAGVERLVFRTGAWRGIDLTNISAATDLPLPAAAVWSIDNVKTAATAV